MTNESLADRAVMALADVKAMGANMDNNHPMRHNVRELKQSAEAILSHAIGQAQRLTYIAERLVKDFDKERQQYEGCPKCGAENRP